MPADVRAKLRALSEAKKAAARARTLKHADAARVSAAADWVLEHDPGDGPYPARSVAVGVRDDGHVSYAPLVRRAADAADLKRAPAAWAYARYAPQTVLDPAAAALGAVRRYRRFTPPPGGPAVTWAGWLFPPARLVELVRRLQLDPSKYCILLTARFAAEHYHPGRGPRRAGS